MVGRAGKGGGMEGGVVRPCMAYPALPGEGGGMGGVVEREYMGTVGGMERER